MLRNALVILSLSLLAACTKIPTPATPNPDSLTSQAFNASNYTSFYTSYNDIPAALWANANGTTYAVGKAKLSAFDNSSDLVLMRYLSNGTADPAFAGGTPLIINRATVETVNKVVGGTDGNVYLFGTRNQAGNPNPAFVILKYSPSGTFLGEALPDLNFAFSPNDAALTTDGKFIVIGKTLSSFGPGQLAIVKFNTGLTLESTFGSGGAVTAGYASGSYATSISLDSLGRLVIAGNQNGNAALWRYTAAGALDSSFTQSVLTGGGYSYSFTDVFQDSQAIYLSGMSYDANFNSRPFVAFYNTNGTPATNITGGRVAGYPANLSMMPGSTGSEVASSLVVRGNAVIVVGSGVAAGGVPAVLSYQINVFGTYNSTYGNQLNTLGSRSNGAVDSVIAGDGSVHVLADRQTAGQTDLAILKFN